MFAMIDIVWFWAGGFLGGALVWHFKTNFVAWGRGIDAAITSAKADVASLEAKAAAVKAAVK